MTERAQWKELDSPGKILNPTSGIAAVLQKDDSVYLGHMLDTARTISVRVTGRSKADYDEDEDL